MEKNNTQSQVINSSKKGLKIAFVGNSSFSLYKFRLGVMRSFISKGYEIIAIAPTDEYSDLFTDEKIKFISIEIESKGKSIFKDTKLTFKLLNIYREEQIDFIFHYTIKPNIYGSLAARYLKIPSIAITTGLGFSFNKINLFNLFIKTLYRFSLQKVLEVWFLNSDDKNIFIKNKVIKKEKTFILHSEGIDSTFYSPRLKSDKSDKFIFLMLSRLIKEKGIEEYVKAAEILKQKGINVECQLLGKQEKESSKNIEIATVKQWHNAKIINYLGEYIDIRNFIANSDCVVLPSYYMEGVPRCLMEAMSMERPIITTNNVGCKELIIDGINGLVCKAKDAEDLADKMEILCNTDINKRKLMALNGRKRILDYFDETKIIEQYHFKLNTYFSDSNAKRLHCIIPDQTNRSIFIDRNIDQIKSSIRNTPN